MKTGAIRFIETPEPVLAMVREAPSQSLLAVFDLGREEACISLPGVADLQLLEASGFCARLTGDAIFLDPMGAGFFTGRL